MPVIAEAAQTNVRLRICLGAAYSDLPEDLQEMVDSETADVRDLAHDQRASVTAGDLALIIGWLHHSDTAWAAELLKEMTEHEPAAAWDVLRVLAVFAEEDSRIRDDVYSDAFAPFMQRHFAAFREKFVALGRKSAAFRDWADGLTRAPTDEEEGWSSFKAEITSI